MTHIKVYRTGLGVGKWGSRGIGHEFSTESEMRLEVVLGMRMGAEEDSGERGLGWRLRLEMGSEGLGVGSSLPSMEHRGVMALGWLQQNPGKVCSSQQVLLSLIRG